MVKSSSLLSKVGKPSLHPRYVTWGGGWGVGEGGSEEKKNLNPCCGVSSSCMAGGGGVGGGWGIGTILVVLAQG